MQIASKLDKNGMTSGSAFNEALKMTILEMGLTRVIETGTYLGNGTTRAILSALKEQNRPFDFYSIEVNPDHYYIAKTNLGNVAGLHLFNGLSVDRADIPSGVQFFVPDTVVVDHEEAVRDAMYLREVDFDVPDNMLDRALAKFNYRPELVVLDSAGNMGMIEFGYLMNKVKYPFILALDDTHHVKHYDTMEFIRDNPKDFEIRWEVEAAHVNPLSGSKYGSAIIMVK